MLVARVGSRRPWCVGPVAAEAPGASGSSCGNAGEVWGVEHVLAQTNSGAHGVQRGHDVLRRTNALLLGYGRSGDRIMVRTSIVRGPQ
jgi:hypothetical protein